MAHYTSMIEKIDSCYFELNENKIINHGSITFLFGNMA